jgi:hypothetical protein
VSNFQHIRDLGRMLDDLEKLRIQHQNRTGAADSPHVSRSLDGLRALEHEAELELVRAWRKHPLAPWAKQIHGVGEKSVARLVAIIGDPAERENPAKLWAYCGVGEPTRKRRESKTQADLFRCGNKYARKQLYVITESFVKCMDSPYRAVYEERREATVDRKHGQPCQICAGKGKDASLALMESWRDGHKHADAMRIAGKAFLLDLWLAARAGQGPSDAHCGSARAGHAPAATHSSSARAGQRFPDDQPMYARAGQLADDSQSDTARAGLVPA